MKKLWFPALLIISFILSAVGHYAGFPYTLEFIISAVSVIFVAGFLGKATESVAHHAGQRLGGFLNATFGNAAELIIGILLVKEGEFDMVKASITGSIIGNLLLVLGLSVLAGGIKYKIQNYNVSLAGLNGSLMLLAIIALGVPAIFLHTHAIESKDTNVLSLIVSGVLIVSYLLWLLFSMITHKDYLADVSEGGPLDVEHEEAAWSKGRSILYLIIATVMVAFVSEWLVDTLDPITEKFGLSAIFVGAFVVAIVGNAAEHSAAVMLALKNKIGAAVEIAVGSSLQIALFVAPVLVFVSQLFASGPMDIVFTVIELAAMGVAVFIAKSITQDGSTNWYEGMLLLAVYAILGVSFYLV
ncbi:calcium/proton exchanger [Paenibacillus pinistramenti]|uniref:calcium/proton exchanger n=1 Tax=Paenibacillus pinistramenti TaxID=1768003 RepID=UPI001108DCF4|nr:calcium/proton exchanger [Paenibacillus pinistramenti]